jgi:hypothetical protein
MNSRVLWRHQQQIDLRKIKLKNKLRVPISLPVKMGVGWGGFNGKN